MSVPQRTELEDGGRRLEDGCEGTCDCEERGREEEPLYDEVPGEEPYKDCSCGGAVGCGGGAGEKPCGGRGERGEGSGEASFGGAGGEAGGARLGGLGEGDVKVAVQGEGEVMVHILL